jgi:hypothetical protein
MLAGVPTIRPKPHVHFPISTLLVHSVYVSSTSTILRPLSTHLFDLAACRMKRNALMNALEAAKANKKAFHSDRPSPRFLVHMIRPVEQLGNQWLTHDGPDHSSRTSHEVRSIYPGSGNSFDEVFGGPSGHADKAVVNTADND